MNLKPYILATSLLTLVACSNNTPNPEMLKGESFVSAAEGTDIILTFDATEMRVNGQVVNLYNGTYEAEGDKIKFGPMASTMMMGPMNAMQAEQDYFQFLTTVESYSLEDGRLTLKNAEGKEIVFQQVEEEPTAEESVTVEEVDMNAPVAIE